VTRRGDPAKPSAREVKFQNALEDILCMQHFHEGNGGCHGPCPVCAAAGALGFDKYLRKTGDQERFAVLQKKHGYA
jgi:hypothetical protein